MTPLNAAAVADGGIAGNGSVVVVEHTADNNIAAFRFRFPKVKMEAAEEDFDAAGRRFRAGAIIIPNANRGALEPALRELGLSGFAMTSAPSVKTHDLDVPRIGYVHSWTRTQDEGWVRAALDTYGIPYTYFGDVKLREGKLRERFDVIIFPHVGGTVQTMVNGIAKKDDRALPYMKTAEFQSLGTPDSSPDIRGGMGLQGLVNLHEFVQQGGTLIVEGSTSSIVPAYNLTPGVSIEEPDTLFARGSIMRGVIADMKSPIVYGYGHDQLPVYFSQGPVMRVDEGGGGFRFFGRGATSSQNVTPMATSVHLSPWDPNGEAAPGDSSRRRVAASQGAERGRGGAAGDDASADGPRVIMRFPARPADMLLSGVLTGGEALSNRAQIVDESLGKGHVVMFAIRPFWRWQTQGTFAMGFNAIMNWNDLDAGKAAAAEAPVSEGR
jgi:hypothetical protein